MPRKADPNRIQPRRVSLDINQLSVNLDDLREALGVPEDVWDRMPDSEKVLLFTQRGVDASMAALQRSQAEQVKEVEDSES